MLGSSYQIARVWGIPVKVHISLILLLVIIGLFMGTSVGIEQGLFRGGIALIGYVVILMALFASIALHELGHSFVAIRKGCRVRQITLMAIGGAAQMERIPTRPRDEIMMAVAGPAVSLVIGITTMSVALWFQSLGFDLLFYLLFMLGGLNLILAAFNLMPAFPMDGGRILRAALTGRLGRLRATYVASRIGKMLAVFFGLMGLFNRQWFLVAIAFYIYAMAGAEYRMIQQQESFRTGWNGFGSSRGNSGWPSWGPADDAESMDDDDEVVVSPPPYRKGPVERVDVHREKHGNPPWFSLL